MATLLLSQWALLFGFLHYTYLTPLVDQAARYPGYGLADWKGGNVLLHIAWLGLVALGPTVSLGIGVLGLQAKSPLVKISCVVIATTSYLFFLRATDDWAR